MSSVVGSTSPGVKEVMVRWPTQKGIFQINDDLIQRHGDVEKHSGVPIILIWRMFFKFICLYQSIICVQCYINSMHTIV